MNAELFLGFPIHTTLLDEGLMKIQISCRSYVDGARGILRFLIAFNDGAT